MNITCFCLAFLLMGSFKIKNIVSLEDDLTNADTMTSSLWKRFILILSKFREKKAFL